MIATGVCSKCGGPRKPNMKCAPCKAEIARRYRAASPEKTRLAVNKYYAENKKARKEAKRLWHAANRDDRNEKRRALRRDKPEQHKEYAKRYAKIRPEVFAAAAGRRRARVINATPSWADKNAIDAVYARAAKTGLTVDHIHPLKGKNFCGLHVPWNLQLLSGAENSRKGNKLIEAGIG